MFLWTIVLAVCLAVCASGPATARPNVTKKPRVVRHDSTSRRAPTQDPRAPVAWCASEIESLSEGMCHVDGGPSPDGRRTLVIFLHGVIAAGTDWQWTQERALLRQAKFSHFEALFPRAPLGKGGYAWSVSAKGEGHDEEAILAAWTRAQKALEKRSGKPFDEVFVMGFSSGAYFVSSLALRGRVDVDGFAVFAGGSARHGATYDDARRPPVFVGVCANDRHTASHSRAFATALAVAGFPHRKDERPTGHMFGDVHVAHAVAYLRKAARSRAGSVAREP